MFDDTSRPRQTGGFRLVRSVNGERQVPGEIDVDHAIDAGSSVVTFDDLTRRGYSSARVLDRQKVAMLIRQAVDDALEHRNEAFLAHERRKIEEESHEHFARLLDQNRHAAAPHGIQDPTGEDHPSRFEERGGAPHREAGLLSELSGMIAGIIRTELSGLGASTDRFDIIERRVNGLADNLEKAQKAFARIGKSAARPSDHEQLVSEERQEMILEKLLEANIQLRNSTGSSEK